MKGQEGRVTNEDRLRLAAGLNDLKTIQILISKNTNPNARNDVLIASLFL